MARKQNLTRGKEAFLEYYSGLLPQFKDSADLEKYLSARNHPVLLFSPMHEAELQSRWQEQGLTWKALPWYSYALFWPPEVPVGTSLPGYKEGWIYSLNPASLLPVLAMAPHTGDAILDACAAPGGKTLAMANLVDPLKTLIVANDQSSPRSHQLRAVLRMFGYDHIPVFNYPAQSLTQEIPDQFDRILVDAPCSSEKHVFNSKSHLRVWSPKRISELSKLQYQIVKAVLELLKPGGTLVYSTCALTLQENEEVVTKILENHSEVNLAPLPKSLPISTPGLNGVGLRVNDPTVALDPMFVAILKKR